MHITPRLESKINELMKVLQTNRKIFSLIEQYEYINEDGDKFTFTNEGMDTIERFIHKRIEVADDNRFNDDDKPIGIISKYIEHNIIPFNELQLENPENLAKAKNSNFYKVINDVVYWWEEDKAIGNLAKHVISFDAAINLFTEQTFLTSNTIEDLKSIYGSDYKFYIESNSKSYDVYYLKTIIDDKHTSINQFKCVDEVYRMEKNFARYVLIFDQNNQPEVVKIVYNLRYNTNANYPKWVIKFVTVFYDDNPPKIIKRLCDNTLYSLKEPMLFSKFKGKPNNEERTTFRMMKFKNVLTNEIIDMSDRDPDSITLNELNDCIALDGMGFRLLMKLARYKYDREKIFPLYEELLIDGTWENYYNERSLTDIERKRREKYYPSNREVFNKYLDIARQANPNFVKNRYDDYIQARDTITYGGPQSIVRKRMHLLFGDKVLIELMKEDPIDKRQDMFLNEWRMYPEDEGDY